MTKLNLNPYRLKDDQQTVGWTAFQTSDRSYCHMSLRLKYGYVRHSGRDYDLHPHPERLDRIARIREISGGGLWRLTEMHDGEATLRWQLDRDNGSRPDAEWYGLKIDDADMNHDIIAFLAKLAKQGIGWNTQPAKVVELLAKMRAVPVKYCDGGYRTFAVLQPEVAQAMLDEACRNPFAPVVDVPAVETVA